MLTHVTVERASLTYFVCYIQCWKQLRCKLNIQRRIEKNTIISLKFDLCSFQHQHERDKIASTVTLAPKRSTWQVTSKLSTKWNKSYLLGCWLIISSGVSLHLWLFGALVFLTLFITDNVENNWGVKWIYRDLPRNMQSFGSRVIYAVWDINKTGTNINNSDVWT